MKVTKLEIRNIGLIADSAIELNQPLIIFYGDIQAGKTTYLNAVRWVFGGAFPADIIRHGETEAMIKLHLDNGSILREFYVARDGSTKARQIVFIIDSKPALRPVEEIEKLLNPFLLDQDFLVRKNELARKKYFAELFAVDTEQLDNENTQLAAQAQNDRAKLSGYGDIDLTAVPEPASVDGLRTQLADVKMSHAKIIEGRRATLSDLRRQYAESAAAAESRNRVVRAHNEVVTQHATGARSLQHLIRELNTKLTDATALLERETTWLATPDNSLRAEEPAFAPPDTSALEASLAEHPDTSALDSAIAQAAADAVRYAQYQKNQARATERLVLEKAISTAERRQNEIKTEKIARLAKVSEESGVPGLAFAESGEFTYQGTTAGMLSTSQLMELSNALSAKYPPGFGVSLIDRGESLGSSVFKLVERAKAEDKTILATVVGERPAAVPEHVGVFVVESGKAT